jgi:hypothetical protein
MNLKDIIKGRILIIAVDTLPLTLTEDAPEVFIYDGVEYNIKDKCCRATALGIRIWQTANEIKKIISDELIALNGKMAQTFNPSLSHKIIKESITIFIPDINYPGEQYIANKEFIFKSYNYKESLYKFSTDIQKEIEQHDTIIIHMIGGIGFDNYWQMPNDKILIYDGFENQLISLPYALQNYDEEYKRNTTAKYKFYYEKILKRINYILYPNEPMKHYYESQLYFNGNLGYNNFKESPLIKFPYLLENNDLRTNRDIGYLYNNMEAKQKLLWYGASYNWYDTRKLIDLVATMENIQLDFVAVKHPRYKNSWDAKLFENLPDNVKVIEEYQDERWNIYKQYDAGILLTKGDIIDNYITSCRLYDMLSYGLPIITNETNPIFKEIEMEKERYNLKKVIVEDTIFNGTECKMKKLSVSW